MVQCYEKNIPERSWVQGPEDIAEAKVITRTTAAQYSINVP